ncbi:MAG: membrane-bound lytic murein transglycosylase MltF [Pseudomonadota bacterium]
MPFAALSLLSPVKPLGLAPVIPPRLGALCLSLCCLLAGCGESDSLQRVIAEGELRVVTRNSPTTYYFDKAGPVGYEYELASRLADELGVSLDIRPVYHLDDLFTALRRGEADLAAAGLTLTGQRQAAYDHTQAYDTLRPQVIYRTGQRRPRAVDQIQTMKIVVLEGSSHAQSLQALRSGGLTELAWEEIPEADSMELLEMVDSGEAELAILDSNEFSVQQSLYPRLKVAFELGSEQDMVWYLPQGSSSLTELANDFISRLDDSGDLERLRELHFGHAAGVTRIGSHTFTRNMASKLPEVRPMIEQVAAEFQLDWHLLAAVAYQESHWDPTATSPTGVRGLMMLTLPTARELGIKDRLDPLQSLRGGARYLKDLKRRMPADIYEPDRTWFTLAAYNIGRGHLEDARVLTERHGGDPHLWQDVMQYLPLLQKSKYHSTARYGYARGREAVTYVQNIRHYDTILKWQDLPVNQPLPPLDTQPLLPKALRSLSLQAL